MSTQMAFRLYQVSAYYATTRQPLPPEVQLGDETLMEYVLRGLQMLKSTVVREKASFMLDRNQFEDHRIEEGDPCFLVLDYKQQGKMIEVQASKGTYGELDKLIGAADMSAQSIRDKAATKDYTARIVFPEDSNTCYVAAKVRGVSQVGTDIFLHISHMFHKMASKVEGNEIKTVSDWYNLKPTPIIDEKRLDSVFNSSKVNALILQKNLVDGTGTRSQGKLKYEMRELNPVVKQQAVETLKKWINRAQRHISSNPQTGAEEVASIFTKAQIVASEDWDDGKIVFEENGKQTTVSERDLGKLFTYPQRDDSSIRDLWNEANMRLHIIARANGVEIPPIDL